MKPALSVNKHTYHTVTMTQSPDTLSDKQCTTKQTQFHRNTAEVAATTRLSGVTKLGHL